VRRVTGGAALALCVVLGVGLAGTAALSCDDKPKKPPTAEAGAASGPSAGAARASGTSGGPSTASPAEPGGDAAPPAAPGCAAATPGGSVLTGKLEPGSVSIAVAKGRALVVNTVYKDPRRLDSSDKPETLESAKAERVILAPTGLPDGPAEPVIDPHGPDEGAALSRPAGAGAGPFVPLTWAVATTFHDELTTMSYGTSRSGSGGCAGGSLVLKGAGAPLWVAEKSCRLASGLAGAARGHVAVALVDGPTQPPVAVKTWPAIADAIVFADGASKTIRLRADFEEGKLSRIEAPAAAVGKTLMAVAYRVVSGAVRELHVVRLDRSGAKVADAVVIDKGGAGAPTLAFDEDTLHVVWATRPSDKEPYALVASSIGPDTTAKPTPRTRLATGEGSAFAPALAIAGGRFALAWMVGDDRSGVVRAGTSRKGLETAVSMARVVSNASANARDPEIGLDGEATFVVWHELGAGTGELRAAALRCPE